MPHLDLAGNKEVLDSRAVGLVESSVMQPDAKLQRVPQIPILYKRSKDL
jgi:hypothetical protein